MNKVVLGDVGLFNNKMMLGDVGMFNYHTSILMRHTHGKKKGIRSHYFRPQVYLSHSQLKTMKENLPYRWRIHHYIILALRL